MHSFVPSQTSARAGADGLLGRLFGGGLADWLAVGGMKVGIDRRALFAFFFP